MTGMARQKPTLVEAGSGVPGATLRGAEATRAKILHSAEKLFGDHGYDGVSVRQIAIEAGVPVALVNYHFGSKDGLFRAIFVLRAPLIYDQRMAGLRLAELETDPNRKLEAVIKALIVPMVHLRNTEKSAGYARILAHEISSPSSRSREIMREFFDPVAHILLDALAKVLPDRSMEEIHWGYHVMLGAMVYTMADNGRMERLSGGLCTPDDETNAAAHMVALLTAALKYGRVPTAGTTPSHDQARTGED